LLFIVLDEMKPDIDRAISSHVLRLHRYQPPGEEDGKPQVDTRPRFQADDEVEDDDDRDKALSYEKIFMAPEAVKKRSKTSQILTVQFVKKYIHYAKNRPVPVLTREAAERIAKAYTEIRNKKAQEASSGLREDKVCLAFFLYIFYMAQLQLTLALF
jgi:DNA replication licensing factor MCM3